MTQATLAELLAIAPGDLDRVLAFGQKLLREKRFSTAVDLHRGVVAIAPDRPEAHIALAIALLGAKKIPDAVTVCTTALAFYAKPEHGTYATEKDLATLLGLRAIGAVRDERLADAHADAVRARLVHDDPVLAKALDPLISKLAAELPKKQVDDETLEFLAPLFREALEGKRSVASVLGLSDNDLMQRATIAQTRFATGDAKGALPIFNGLIALDGSVPLFRLGKALCLALLGDEVRAIEAFDDAVRATEGVPGGGDLVALARLQRGLYLQQRGDIARAADDLKAALAHESLAPAQRAVATQALGAVV
jgi:tetratricopeptide (TPR) repeat protein